MTDELDGFIARYTDLDNWTVLLPAILDNLTAPPNSTNFTNPNIFATSNVNVNAEQNIPTPLSSNTPVTILSITCPSTNIINENVDANSHLVLDADEYVD